MVINHLLNGMILQVDIPPPENIPKTPSGGNPLDVIGTYLDDAFMFFLKTLPLRHEISMIWYLDKTCFFLDSKKCKLDNVIVRGYRPIATSTANLADGRSTFAVFFLWREVPWTRKDKTPTSTAIFHGWEIGPQLAIWQLYRGWNL